MKRVRRSWLLWMVVVGIGALVVGCGGVAGDILDATVENTYNIGTVSGNWNRTDIVGGIVGGMTGSEFDVKSSYYKAGSAPPSDGDTPNPGFSKTEGEMKQQSTYVEWDFDHVWTMGSDGYPDLADNGRD